MNLRRDWCALCDRYVMRRVICGDELVELFGAAADPSMLPGTWSVQLVLCPGCRQVQFVCSLVTKPTPELDTLFPKDYAEKGRRK